MESAVLVLMVVFGAMIVGFYQLAMKVNSPRRGSARRARVQAQQQQRQRQAASMPAPEVEAIPYARVRSPEGWSEWSRAEPIEGMKIITVDADGASWE
jgi:hypothetical protein